MALLNKTVFRILLRRGPAANLTAAAVDSVEGEPAFTDDTHQMYVSDGTQFLRVPTLNSDGELAGDLEWDAASEGPILVDRTTGWLYRLKVDGGVLSIEVV